MSAAPREPSEAGSHSILGTLLGDYTWGRMPEPVPVAAFVRTLGEFGISEMAARLAVERVAQRGLLTKVKQGRSVLYRLSDYAIAAHHERYAHFIDIGAEGLRWDGSWTTVLTSVPETQREQRVQLRTRLTAAGFARLYDAVWVRPGKAALERARTVLAGLPEIQATLLVARHEPGRGGRNPIDAYDLQTVADRYAAYTQQHAALHRAARAGKVREADALVRRTLLMDAWRGAVRNDPDLPDELLPPGFPRAAARELFVQTYDALGAAAAARLRRVVADVQPELAQHLEHRVSAQAHH